MNGEKPREILDEINKERGPKEKTPNEVNFGKEPTEKAPDGLKPRKKRTTDLAPKEALGVEQKPEQKIEKQEYNFKEIKEIESAMTSIVEQLRDSIEKGEYSSLLSDEAGGRIPTLILNKIFNERSPEKVNSYFFPGGIDIHHINASYNRDSLEYKEARKNIQKMKLGSKRILVITQFSSTGKSLESIGLLLNRLVINNFDFVDVYKDNNSPNKEQLAKKLKEEFNSKIFFSDTDIIPEWIIGEHEAVSGIRKHHGKIERHTSYENIKKARADIKLMAEKIIKKVWGN